MTDEQLEAIKNRIKEKHAGAVLLLTAPSGAEVVVRRPSRAEWKRFQLHASDESRQFDAGEALVKACILHPTPEEWNSMLDEEPGLSMTFLKGLTAFAGASATVEKKAL